MINYNPRRGPAVWTNMNDLLIWNSAKVSQPSWRIYQAPGILAGGGLTFIYEPGRMRPGQWSDAAKMTRMGIKPSDEVIETPPAIIRREQVPCNLCGANHPRPLFRVHAQDRVLNSVWLDGVEIHIEETETIVQCQQCGLGYVNPRIEDLPGLAPYSVAAEMDYFESTHALRLAAYGKLLEKVPAWSGLEPSSLLDIGCGDGTLLEAAGLAGYRKRLGLEISSTLVELVRVRLGDDLVSSQTVGSLPLASFDVVGLINVLEHVRQPLEMLRQIRECLVPGGILLVHVPNFRSLAARLRGPRWHQIEPYAHFYYFTADVLGEMLRRAGLIPVSRFHIEMGGAFRKLLQRVSAQIGLELDNGLGIVARRAENGECT